MPRGHLFMPRGYCLATPGHLFVPWTIYNVLHFSDDMDQISEGKDPKAFLLDTAEKSKEDGNRVSLLVWN